MIGNRGKANGGEDQREKRKQEWRKVKAEGEKGKTRGNLAAGGCVACRSLGWMSTMIYFSNHTTESDRALSFAVVSGRRIGSKLLRSVWEIRENYGNEGSRNDRSD